MSDRPLTDPGFIKSLVEGEAESIERVVKAYTNHLYKAGLGQGLKEEEAQDLCHSTWATFFEVVKRFENRSHIRTFIFGIFYNKLAEYRRRQRRENLQDEYDPIDEVISQKYDEKGAWAYNPTHGPERFAQMCESLEIIERCLENLPSNQRTVFTLKLVEEEESEEICNNMGISSTNLRQILFRAKNRMKECIEGQMK